MLPKEEVLAEPIPSYPIRLAQEYWNRKRVLSSIVCPECIAQNMAATGILC